MTHDGERDESPAGDSGSRKRALRAQLSSLFALAVSFLALASGVYQARLMNVQTRLMQTQARASVWPYLSIGYAISDEGDKRGYAWLIDNDGVGPARIESVTLTLDGKPLRRWSEAFHVLYGDAHVNANYSQVYGKVLPPNTNRETTIEAVKIPDLDQARIFYAAQERFEMTICYCSVYAECWIARRKAPGAQPVERCDTAGTVQFEEQM